LLDQIKAKKWQDLGATPYFACVAAIAPLFRSSNRGSLPVSTLPLKKGCVTFADKGFHTMRKIILAAAIATSALGLAACSGETAGETAEAADAMAADAEANADAAVEAAGEATEAAGEATEAAGEAVEGAADATAAAATDAADAAEATADEAMKAAE
jgi:hypothetical protein